MTTRAWSALAVLLSVFVAGVLVGVGGHALIQSRQRADLRDRIEARRGFDRPARVPGNRGDGPRGPGPGVAPGAMVDQLERALDLTTAQRDTIEALVRRRSEQTEALMGEVRPRLRAQLDSTNDEIRTLLTSEQQERFDGFLARARRGFDRGGGPPRGGPDGRPFPPDRGRPR